MQAGLELWARPAGAGHVLLASPLKRTQDNASRPSRACRTLGRFRTRLCNRRIEKEDRRSDAARLFLRRNRVFGTHTHSNLGSTKGTAAKVNCEERRDFRRPSSPGSFRLLHAYLSVTYATTPWLVVFFGLWCEGMYQDVRGWSISQWGD
jgi:hypothetical protein